MKILCIFVFCMFIFFSFSQVSAVSIVGVSPGAVRFDNVLRGGYAERYLTISSSTEEEVFISGKPRGEIASWLEFSENFTISRDNPGKMFLAVKPPIDVPNGNYTGFLRISTSDLGQLPSGKAVNAVRAVLDVAITVEITDVEIQSCAANSFEVTSAEKGDDIEFTYKVYNQGNVRLKPLVQVEIWDQEQIELVKEFEFRSNDILPTTEEVMKYLLSSFDLDVGQYWVNFKVPDCFSDGFLTFDVLEPGSLKADGVLTKIYSIANGEVGDTLPIIAEFENTGEKDVDSQFKGQISLDGKIVRVLESEKTTAPVSRMTNFTFFFTPEKSGNYVVSGRVFYDKKRTFELSTVLRVFPNTFGFKEILLILIYVVLMISIAILFYKIHKERKNYLWKLRNLRMRRSVYGFFVVFVLFSCFASVSAATASFYFDTSSPTNTRLALDEILRSDDVLFQVTTDRSATCKYSVNSGVSFLNMEGVFDFTFETLHKKDLVGLSEGTKRYFVRCRDTFGNDSAEFEATFAVRLPVRASIVLDQGEVLGNGRTEVFLHTTKALSQTPTLSYSYDGVNYDPIPLFGSGNEWSGYMTVSSVNEEITGTFRFDGQDLEGVVGNEISSGGTFFVDTQKPETISDFKATGYDGEIKLSWSSADDGIEMYKIYRSTETGVELSDFYKNVETNLFTDTDVERGKTYYYRISVVDTADNEGDLSKEVYTTALLENYSAQSGLELRYVGFVDNFIAQIDNVFSISEDTRSSLKQKSGTEGTLYELLNLEADANGAEAELASLKREIDSYKLQSLTKSELDKKLNSAQLKLNTIKRKIPENIILINEKNIRKEVQEEAVWAHVLALWPDLESRMLDETVSASLSAVNSGNFAVETNGYNVEIVYMDGTRRELSLIRESIDSDFGSNDSVSIVESVPRGIAESYSDLSLKNSDYELLKEDTLLSFGSDIHEIVYTLDKKIDLNSLKDIDTFVLIRLEEKKATENSLSGYFAFVDLSKGKEYIGVIFAVFLVMGLSGYLFFMRRSGQISEKLIPLKQLIADAEEHVLRGRIDVARDLYHAASLHYRTLEQKLQKAIYADLETLHRRIHSRM